ncbi:MAG: ZIP family metal transporter [Chloroflexi bacterium]|nr:ZIP family metal transporter [Chloroflexota bacterium]
MIVYLFATLAAMGDIVGGVLPFHPWGKKVSMRYVLAFAAGTVMGAVFFELLPEAKAEQNYLYLALGFFVFYLVEKGLELHAYRNGVHEDRPLNWVTVLGMASDNIIDGVGIGVSFIVRPELGVIITLAVIAHEVPQGMTTTLIMRRAGYGLNRLIPILVFAAAMYPAGVAISGYIPERLVSQAIAFVTGVFIYVGAAALLNEAHKTFNYRVVATFMLGSALALALRFLE